MIRRWDVNRQVNGALPHVNGFSKEIVHTCDIQAANQLRLAVIQPKHVLKVSAIILVAALTVVFGAREGGMENPVVQELVCVINIGLTKCSTSLNA